MTGRARVPSYARRAVVRSADESVRHAHRRGAALDEHPDVAFISRHRLPAPEPIGYPELGPDLVVEVLSPGDRPGEVLAKVADWLSAGTRLVWVIDPERRIARVYRQDGSESIVSADQALLGEDVLPGFSCPLREML